jgi:hypothetical protein
MVVNAMEVKTSGYAGFFVVLYGGLGKFPLEGEWR